MKMFLKGGPEMRRTALYLFIPIVTYAAFVIVMYRDAQREEVQALASLSGPTLSQQFNSAFWVHELNEKSPLWTQALSSCERTMSPVSRPNCSVVAVVANPAAQEELARQMLAERKAA